ncbi:MAG: helix-turn-helix domain-containing protein [Betaproteobacteria bacterium]|nr:helix-turn-helix domain-containing protein [Betaproteobacteria bacterium]
MTKTTFTLAEAAVLLSCHAETLRRAIKNGALYAARLGREYRISRTDLQAFWAERGGSDLFGDGELPLPPTGGVLSVPQPREKDKPSYIQLKLLD